MRQKQKHSYLLSKLKKNHWDAAHNVPVYVLGEQFSIQRYSDDGEPSGTAGVPILDLMKKEGLTNLVCVVTRYFGGVKLGTGGLVRAYTQSAKQAIEAACIVDRVSFMIVRCTYDYALHGKIQNTLTSYVGVIVKASEFSEHVCTSVYVDIEGVEHFCNTLIEITSAQVDLQRGDIVYLTILDGMVMRGD